MNIYDRIVGRISDMKTEIQRLEAKKAELEELLSDCGDPGSEPETTPAPAPAPARKRAPKPAGLRPHVVQRHMDAVIDNITDEPQTGRELIKLTGLTGPEFRAAAAELRRRGVITNDGANWSRVVAGAAKSAEAGEP